MSLRLGVVPPNVNGLVPDHIQKPGYALRGEPSEWAAGIPINGAEEIEKCRRAGQLAKKILELGGTLVKVIWEGFSLLCRVFYGGSCMYTVLVSQPLH